MKVDPKTGARYAHTPEEWAEVLRKHGSGMSLPGSVAARVAAAFQEEPVAKREGGVLGAGKLNGTPDSKVITLGKP